MEQRSPHCKVQAARRRGVWGERPGCEGQAARKEGLEGGGGAREESLEADKDVLLTGVGFVFGETVSQTVELSDSFGVVGTGWGDSVGTDR